MMYAIRQCSCGVIFLLFYVQSVAQVVAPDSSRTMLPEVMVQANAYGNISSPTSSQTLSGKRLESLSSFSVADAIRYFSGVQLKDYGGIGGLKTVNVRSMGTQHVGVFLDGASIGNAQNGTVDLGKFSLDNIDAIQLYNGNATNLLQPARAYFASSTLYLKTKFPQVSDIKKTAIKAGLKTGSFGLINPSVLWWQHLKPNVSLSLNTELVQAHGHYRYRYKTTGYDTTAIRNNAAITAFRAEAGLFKKYQADKGEAFIKAYLYTSERGLPGAIVANKFYSSQKLWDRNFFLHGSFKKNITNKYEVLAHAKYTNDFTRYLDPEYITLSGPLNNRYHQEEWYGSVAQKVSIKPWWQLALSTDFSYNSLNANLYRFSYPRRYSYIGVLSSNIDLKKLLVQTALLYSYFKEQVKYYQSAEDQKAASPYIGISWQPFSNKGFRLRSFYKASLRMPTFNDLYYTLVGNTFLEPEYTRQWNAGFTYNTQSLFFQHIFIQADGYYNHVKNKIVAVPATNLFRWMMINQGRVSIKGIDVNAKLLKKIGDSLTIETSVAYTYQKAVNKTKGASSFNHQIPYTPVHSGTLHGYIQWYNWGLNYSYIYTGERYALPENIARNHIQPWYTTDLGLVWHQQYKKTNYKIGVDVNNVFNQYYDVVLNFPMPGRNIRLSLIANF